MFFGFLKTFFLSISFAVFSKFGFENKTKLGFNSELPVLQRLSEKKKLCTEKISTPYTAHFVQCTVRNLNKSLNIAAQC